MKKLELPNHVLLYTDIPENKEKLARARRLFESLKLREIPRIAVVSPSPRPWYLADDDFMIVDGNHRAYVASEMGLLVPAMLLEDDRDLRTLRKVLDKNHRIISLGIRSLGDLIDDMDNYVMAEIIGQRPLNFGD